MKKYVVTSTAEERQHLEQLLAKGKAAARTLARATRRLTIQVLANPPPRADTTGAAERS